MITDLKTKKNKVDFVKKISKNLSKKITTNQQQSKHDSYFDKIIHGLTDINFNLDLKLTRSSLDNKSLNKLTVGVKPFAYIKELDAHEKRVYKLQPKNLDSKNRKSIKHIIDKIIPIKDGFARGVSNYVNAKYKQEYNITNAFVKLWEIYNTFDWLLPKDKKAINVFHIAEAPGQWINTTNTYFKKHMPTNTKYEWYANSLNPDHPEIKKMTGPLKNDYGFIKKYKERWIWGADETGDITSTENIKWYSEFLKEKMASVDLVTGDAGLNVNNAPLDLLQKLEFAQMVMVACTSSVGGSCIIKHFLPYLPSFKESNQASGFFMSFMFMYHLMFKEFHMIKPLSSSPGSGEFYVVANGFLGLPDDVKNKLLLALENFKVNQPIFEMDDIPKSFVAKVCKFINKLMDRNIENSMITGELIKCHLKKGPRTIKKIDCNYYFGPEFRDIKDNNMEKWLKKYKFTL
jgi:23S rRNA U2552 (ribose-2'-O)-methylase RlmE/FtsJ